jgi:hypothetical protein
MRKLMFVLVVSGYVLLSVAQVENRSALFGVVMGLGLGLFLTFLGTGAGVSFRRALEQTRLDEQILSVGDLPRQDGPMENWFKELDPSAAWMFEMQEGSVRSRGNPTRYYERVEDLPRAEILAEFVR